MSKTSLVRAQGIRDGTEQRVTENYAATLAQNLYGKEVSDRTAAITAAVAAEAALRAAADTLLQTNINNEATARANTDNEIANGTRTITPKLGSGTKYGNDAINAGLAVLAAVTYNSNVDTYLLNKKIALGTAQDFNTSLGTLSINAGQVNLAPQIYAGFSTLAAIAAAVATLNGNDTVNGSVDKKVKDAIDAFASAITEDGIINTYKEVLDWIAAHGADFAALVGQVNTNTGRIATLETNMPTPATAAEIREAWNPTPEPEPSTPTVTISGTYDDVNSALIVTSTELDKLAAIGEGETFDLVIHASGVEESGAAKYVTNINTNQSDEPPSYGFYNGGLPLWDGEYSYDTFNGCVMVSQYTAIDAGEIHEGSW